MIILKGEPKSTQHIYAYTCKGGYARSYMTEQGKSMKETYGWEAKAQTPKFFDSEDLAVSIRLYFSTKRVHDWDNYHKLSMDALSGIAYTDDAQIKRAIVEVMYDKKNPRIEIDILPL